MPLQHEARDLHFFISHTKHSRVYYISTFSTFILYPICFRKIISNTYYRYLYTNPQLLPQMYSETYTQNQPISFRIY